MDINKQAFELIGITMEDYLDWCNDNKVSACSRKTVREFFRKVRINQIVRDSRTGKLKTLRIDCGEIIK